MSGCYMSHVLSHWQEDIILPVRHALQYYSDMQNALDEEKKRKASLEAKNNVKWRRYVYSQD